MALSGSLSAIVACGVALVGHDADGTVVWLRGEHDISTEAALSEAMARAIALDDADLVVDLSGVQFMGAATVGVIVRNRNLLRLRSRSLALRSPSTRARRVLHLCGLADRVDPRPVDATPRTGIRGALGTWVAVPPADRCDRRAEPSAPKPTTTTDRVGAGPLGAARKASADADDHRVDERTTTVDGRGGTVSCGG
jgi:anti-sigma B factor antagonist